MSYLLIDELTRVGWQARWEHSQTTAACTTVAYQSLVAGLRCLLTALRAFVHWPSRIEVHPPDEIWPTLRDYPYVEKSS